MLISQTQTALTGAHGASTRDAKHMPELLRKGHFLGAKLRSVRKRHGLTLEDLSVGCPQRHPARAPAV